MYFEVVLEKVSGARGVYRVQANDPAEAIRSALARADSDPATLRTIPERRNINVRDLTEDNGRA